MAKLFVPENRVLRHEAEYPNDYGEPVSPAALSSGPLLTAEARRAWIVNRAFPEGIEKQLGDKALVIARAGVQSARWSFGLWTPGSVQSGWMLFSARCHSV